MLHSSSPMHENLKNPIYLQPKETMYGSLNRLEWMKKFITKKQKIIDVGCGTGYMITIPLIAQGYDVIGYDLDQKSIDYGKNLLRNNNLDENRLICKNINTLSLQPDVIILSEILEHLSNKDLDEFLSLIFSSLKPGGIVLVTIPNGYGLFEFESFLWYKAKIGKLLEKLYIVESILIIKNKLLGINTVEAHPSSLDNSSHLQRFTYFSIEKKLKRHGFFTKQKQGGSLMSGPFSNLFFTGFKPIMKLNLFLGKAFSFFAADFYIAVQKPFFGKISSC